MKLPGYCKFKNLINSILKRLCGLYQGLFNAEKLPKISAVSVRCFRLKDRDKILVLTKGGLIVPHFVEVSDLVVSAGGSQHGSLRLFPVKRQPTHNSEDLREFSFFHFAFVPQNGKKITLTLKYEYVHLFTYRCPKAKDIPLYVSKHKPLFFQNEMPGDSCKSFSLRSEIMSYVEKPIKVLLVSHNLNIEGAPKVLLEIAEGLSGLKCFLPIALSPVDGVLKSEFHALNIPVFVCPEKDQGGKCCDLNGVGCHCRDLSIVEVIESEKPDLVFANTIESYDLVNICDVLNIPVVWMIHESSHYNKSQLNLGDIGLGELYKAFLRASVIVFCSSRTMELYQKLNFNHNFTVIHNSIIDNERKQVRRKKKRLEARAKLNIPHDSLMLLNVGIINENKNQGLIIKAMQQLKANNLLLYLVGARPGIDYQEEVIALIRDFGLGEHVRLIPFQKDVAEFYQAADIFVFPSLSESYPLAVLEAMMFGLPVLATPVFGINEQLEFGTNAWAIIPTDENDLAQKIKILSNDKGLRKTMGVSSRALFDKMPSMDDMRNAHVRVLFEVWKQQNHHLKKLKNAE